MLRHILFMLILWPCAWGFDQAAVSLDLQGGAGNGFVMQALREGAVGDPRVATEGAGGVHVTAWRVANIGGDGYIPAELYYQYFDGTSWTSETIFTLGQELLDETYDLRQVELSYDLQLDSGGRPVILLGWWQWTTSGTTSGRFKVNLTPTVSLFQKISGVWQSESVDLGNPQESIRDLSFALDHLDFAHIVFRNRDRSLYYVQQQPSVGWTTPELIVGLDAARKGLIGIDNNNVPIAVFACDQDSEVWLCYASKVSSAWSVETIVDCSVFSGSVCEVGLSASLAIDPTNNHIHVSHYVSLANLASLVLHTFFDGGTWQTTTVADGQSTSALETSIALSYSGKIGILSYKYSDYPRAGAVTFELHEKSSSGLWVQRDVWYAGDSEPVALSYSGEDPVSVFRAVPIYLSLSSGTAAGWTSVVPDDDSASTYRFKFSGLAAALPGNFQYEQDSDFVSVTTGTLGANLYLNFEDGLFDSRLPTGYDAPGNMLALVISDIDIARATTLGDFNNDGLTDQIIAGRQTGTAEDTRIEFHARSVDYNLFDSHIYGPPGIVDPAPPFPYQNTWDMASADFNGDGNLDFIVGGDGAKIYLYLGNGDGTFQVPPGIITGGIVPHGIDTEDINGDSVPDFCVAGNFFTWKIECYLGNGDGTFVQVLNEVDHNPSIDQYQTSQGITLSDFDNDGIVDAVVTNYPGSLSDLNGLAFYKGNGDGTFVTAPLLSGPEIGTGTTGFFFRRSVDNAYFDEDLNTDVIMLDSSNSLIYVYSGNGDGTFSILDQQFLSHPNAGTCGATLCLLDPNLATQNNAIYLPAAQGMTGISTKVYDALSLPLSDEEVLLSVLEDLLEAVSTLPEEALSKKKVSSRALANMVAAVMGKVTDGDYEGGLNQLQNAILKKFDGCAANGTPDKNDWITSCTYQTQPWTLADLAKALLENLV